MRKRNVAILFRLNKKEAEALDKKVKKSGLNREAYLRQLISGVVPKDAPPLDYYSARPENLHLRTLVEDNYEYPLPLLPQILFLLSAMWISQ